jgi:hypothetical protein
MAQVLDPKSATDYINCISEENILSDWYALEIQETLTRLESDEASGLSEQEATRRLAEYGPNELVERGTLPPLQILLNQFKETMVVILVIAAVVSFALGESPTPCRPGDRGIERCWVSARNTRPNRRCGLEEAGRTAGAVRRCGHIREVSR